MRRCLYILLGIGLSAFHCNADTRWCSIAVGGSSEALIYPPIARAARVYGVVLSRVTYSTTGEVVRVEAISGPPMLSNSLGEQMGKWSIKTDATGEGLCQSLVIADFRLHDSSDPVPIRPTFPAISSILRLSADGETFCLCDPNAEIRTSWRNPFLHLGYAVKRGVARLLRHPN